MSKTILVVEDDADILANLVEFLESEGYEAISARHGREALDLLAKIDPPPSAIILDLMMPVLDGAGFRAEQLADPRIASIPVVLLSADHQVESKRLKLGATEFLRKPLDIDELSRILRKF